LQRNGNHLDGPAIQQLGIDECSNVLQRTWQWENGRFSSKILIIPGRVFLTNVFFLTSIFLGGWCMTTRTIFCTYFVKHWSLVVLGIFEIGHEVISAMLIFNFQLTAGHHLGSP
jgi:hypothetical protein